MSKKNSRNLTLWKTLLNKVNKAFRPIRESFNDFNAKYPNINQTIQLTFIYFFAIVDLHFAILNNVFSLGYFPDILTPVFPIIQGVLQSPFFNIKFFFCGFLYLFSINLLFLMSEL